jgi:hypothetical protein
VLPRPAPTELITQEAFEKSYKRPCEEGRDRHRGPEAHAFLPQRGGVHYAHPESVGGLLRRKQVKLKTGRPRHEKADAEEQEAFKKSSPRR